MAHPTTASLSAAPGSGGQRTIAALWRKAAGEPRASVAYRVEEGAGWRDVSWAEAARQVDELAHGLLALGLKKGDVVSILADTRLEWVLLDFALASLGIVVVPIYPSSSARECAYILGHSEATAIAVDDEGQLAKVTGRRDLPRLEHVLTFAGLEELRALGRARAGEQPHAVAAAALEVSEADVFTYLYTSGTTGPPKGCVITHGNYFAMTTMIHRLPGLVGPDDVVLLFLPLAHNFGRLIHLCGAYEGFTTAFCPDVRRLRGALRDVRPTLLPSVPRVYETVEVAVRTQFDAATGARRKLVDWSLSVGSRVSAARSERRTVPRALALQHRLADRLVYSKVKAQLGGRLRFAISGGAALARETAEFFHAADILILEGYGLTECTSACSVNRPDRFRLGTVGPALPGCELRIAEDGEILIRGENVFAGYLKDPEATSSVLTADGFLRSGDVGELDAEGFLKITDRKKDLIVTAGGKNVSPQNLENELKRSRYVSQVLVIGSERPYVAALITLDEQAVTQWAREHDLGATLEELAETAEVRRLIGDFVRSVNRELAPHERVRRFAILKRDFSQEAGEVTPTLKLKRRVCEQHFADEIEALYRG